MTCPDCESANIAALMSPGLTRHVCRDCQCEVQREDQKDIDAAHDAGERVSG